MAAAEEVLDSMAALLRSLLEVSLMMPLTIPSDKPLADLDR